MAGAGFDLVGSLVYLWWSTEMVQLDCDHPPGRRYLDPEASNGDSSYLDWLFARKRSLAHKYF